MATNQTINYHLNQWEPTDQVLRTEFNADNVKIETALDGKLSTIEVVAEITTTSNSMYFSLDLTRVDWNQWSIVAAVSNPLLYTAERTGFSVDCPTVNIERELSGEVTPLAGPNLYLLFPMRDGGRQIHYLIFPGGPWWAAFLYAVPANAIVITVLASVWKYRMVNFISVTALIWSALACVYVTSDTTTVSPSEACPSAESSSSAEVMIEASVCVAVTHRSKVTPQF